MQTQCNRIRIARLILVVAELQMHAIEAPDDSSKPKIGSDRMSLSAMRSCGYLANVIEYRSGNSQGSLISAPRFNAKVTGSRPEKKGVVGIEYAHKCDEEPQPPIMQYSQSMQC